jgi:hypothetical protein
MESLANNGRVDIKPNIRKSAKMGWSPIVFMGEPYSLEG